MNGEDEGQGEDAGHLRRVWARSADGSGLMDTLGNGWRESCRSSRRLGRYLA
jgi:hypothetical protein